MHFSHENNIESISPEPSWEEEIEYLEHYFEREQVFFYYALRSHAQYMRMSQTDVEATQWYNHGRVRKIAQKRNISYESSLERLE